MKALFTLITITCIVNLSYAQTFFSGQVEQRPCLFDSTQMITQLVDWDIYQTIDGTADGDIDSTNCFEVLVENPDANWLRIYFDLSDFDKSRPLIFRSRIDSLEQYPLVPNSYYQVEAYNGVNLPQSTDTPIELRSQIQITTTIPSEDGSTLIDRIDKLYPNAETNEQSIYSCITTQKFESDQYLKEIKYLVNLNELDSIQSDSVAIRPNVYLYNLSQLNSIESITVPESSYNSVDNQYEYNLNELDNFLQTILIGHTLEGYPSVNNIDYVDVNLEENKPESQQIILNQSDPYFTILFQEYARFRAGLVDGSDSIRHNLEVHIDSTYMCMGIIIDLVLDPSVDLYLKGSGGLDFNTYRSCITTLGSSAIHIDNGYSVFGDNGNGMIALIQDGEIHVHSGNTLEIGARIIHNRDQDYWTPAIVLHKDATLFFNEYADIIHDLPSDLLIDVYMHEGATIDMGNLSLEDQQKLNIIRVQEDNITEQDNLSIHPNPSTSLSKITSSQIINSLMVFDQMGRLIYEADEINKKDYQLNTAQYDQGVYFIRINTKSNIISSKFIKG